MMVMKTYCMVCFHTNGDYLIPKPNGIAVSCDYCGYSFCGFNHLMSHICTRRQKEDDLTIEDIFREVNGNPDWGVKPIRLEIWCQGKKLEAEK